MIVGRGGEGNDEGNVKRQGQSQMETIRWKNRSSNRGKKRNEKMRRED